MKLIIKIIRFLEDIKISDRNETRAIESLSRKVYRFLTGKEESYKEYYIEIDIRGEQYELAN